MLGDRLPVELCISLEVTLHEVARAGRITEDLFVSLSQNLTNVLPTVRRACRVLNLTAYWFACVGSGHRIGDVSPVILDFLDRKWVCDCYAKGMLRF